MKLGKVTTIFFLIVLINDDLKAQQPDSLIWSDELKLSWSDFKGIPDDTIKTIYRQKVGAISSVGIGISYDTIIAGTPCFKLQALFFREESWTRLFDDKSLQHEQLHFDLTEVTTRRLREKATECKTLTFDGLLILVDEYMRKNYLANYSYDSATLRGNYSQQLLWNERIRKELEELKEYGEEVLICPKSK